MNKKDTNLLAEAYNNVLKEESRYSHYNPSRAKFLKPKSEENDPNRETVMNSDARYLESIADKLSNIGARINSGNVRPEDGNYLQEIAGEVEKLASKLR